MQGKLQTKIKGKTLRRSYSKMFFKIALLKNLAITVKKTPILECLFNKLPGLNACTLLKRDPNSGVSLRTF